MNNPSKLIKSVNNFIEFDNTFSNIDDDLKYYEVISVKYDLLSSIQRCEKSGIEKPQILKALEPVIAIHGRSPFIKRSQEWPRGYAGDFETIEYLCNAENKSAINTVEYYLENLALKGMMTQQHRNKVHHQADIILETVLNNTDDTKILSIASGSNRDIFSIAKYIENKPVKFVLNDMDKDAIEFSKQRLDKIADKCDYVHGNIIRKINQLEKMGKFDLVVAGGLFDYLTDKQISFLLKNIIDKLLKPKGRIFFTNITNITTGNPYRIWMEYLANWVLIGRSEADMLNIINGIDSMKGKQVNIKRDETGLALLVEISS